VAILANDSVEIWHGLLFGGISLFIGIAASFASIKTKLFKKIGFAPLVAVTANNMVLVLTVALYRSSNDLVWAILPQSIHDMAPAHRLLVIPSSTIGTVFGVIGCIQGRRINSSLAVIVSSACGFACLCHLLVIGTTLLMNWKHG
jgi:hypothetical protein